MIYKVQIHTRTPADDGTGETILATRDMFVDHVAIPGVNDIMERLRAANVADVTIDAPIAVEYATTADVAEAVDEAMRKRYGTGAANLAEIETRELARAVINQGRTLQALAESMALLTRAVMTGERGAAEVAAHKLGGVPALRAQPAVLEVPAPRPGQTVRVRGVDGPVDLVLRTDGPSEPPEAARRDDDEDIEAAEPPEVAAARALIASVDGGRTPRGGARDVRLPIDTSTAPPTLIQRGPDGKLVPQVPVIRADGSNSERLGDNAAANVQSQGWGVAGKRASSAIETFDPDSGKFVTGQLPIVGDSLRPPRSDIE